MNGKPHSNEEAAARIIDVMVKTGDVKVAHNFAAEVNKDSALLPHMRHVIAVEDAKRNVEPDVVAKALDALTDAQREAMATLALAGYRFHRGTFYWRCVSPTNMTVDSLQPELTICIARAVNHNEERTNGKYQGKP